MMPSTAIFGTEAGELHYTETMHGELGLSQKIARGLHYT